MSYIRSNIFLHVTVVALFLSGCNLYDGPIRNAPTGEVRTPLPPPITKLVGQPLTKTEYIDKAYQDIKNSLHEAEVQLIEDSIKVLFPNHILYNSRSNMPTSDYKTPLDEFSILLKKYRKTNILVTGHTDNKGNEYKNKILSTERAKRITDYLEFCGIGVSRLEAWGLGSLIPIATNETVEGRAFNRRVEFVVLYDEKK